MGNITLSKDLNLQNYTYTIVPEYFFTELNLSEAFILGRLLFYAKRNFKDFSLYEQSDILNISRNTLKSWLENLENKKFIKIHKNNSSEHDYEITKLPRQFKLSEKIKIIQDYSDEFSTMITKILVHFDKNRNEFAVIYPTNIHIKNAIPQIYKYWETAPEYRNYIGWLNLFDYLLFEEWMTEGKLTFSALIRFSDKHWESAQKVNSFGKRIKPKRPKPKRTKVIPYTEKEKKSSSKILSDAGNILGGRFKNTK